MKKHFLGLLLLLAGTAQAAEEQSMDEAVAELLQLSEVLIEIAEAWSEKPQFLFPEKSEAPTTIAAEKKCEKWLTELMSSNSKPEKAKKYYRTDANNKYKVGLRAFDRAWANALKETGNTNWSKRGRKS